MSSDFCVPFAQNGIQRFLLS